MQNIENMTGKGEGHLAVKCNGSAEALL